MEGRKEGKKKERKEGRFRRKEDSEGRLRRKEG